MAGTLNVVGGLMPARVIMFAQFALRALSQLRQPQWDTQLKEAWRRALGRVLRRQVHACPCLLHATSCSVLASVKRSREWHGVTNC